MNGTLQLEAITKTEPLEIQLLSEDELATIRGGWGMIAAGAALAGGGLAVAVIGVAIGVGVYYFSR